MSSALLAALAVLAFQDAATASSQANPPQLEQPKRVRFVPPEYDPRAYKAGFSGPITLECEVGPDGGVRYTKILRGIPLLSERAVAAVRKWKYEPLVVNGVRTPFIVTVTVNFGPEPPTPEVASIIELLEDHDAVVREYMALQIVREHYRFPAPSKPKLRAILDRMAASDEQENVRKAAASALAGLEK